MQVDFSKTFKNFDGTVIPEAPDKPDGFPLRTACVNALMVPASQGEPPLSGEEQVKRFDLATAIYAHKEPLELNAEQVALLKAQVALFPL